VGPTSASDSLVTTGVSDYFADSFEEEFSLQMLMLVLLPVPVITGEHFSFVEIAGGVEFMTPKVTPAITDKKASAKNSFA
jgi:hypothetical protein